MKSLSIRFFKILFTKSLKQFAVLLLFCIPTTASSFGGYAFSGARKIVIKPDFISNTHAGFSGWVTGGILNSSNTSKMDGTHSSPVSSAVDPTNDYFYVADDDLDVVMKYKYSTGAFVGWIGAISQTPTGGDPGCTSASTVTPGWCKGGTPASAATDGGFSGIVAISLDTATQTLYVLESSAILKINAATGAFLGWIGTVAVLPTGGAAGCTTTSVNAFTPGWCTGGQRKSGSFNLTTGQLGSMDSFTFHAFSNYIFVARTGSMLRFNATTGAYGGWIGKISTKPTAGGASCTGAAVGAFTPTWCIGGAGDGYGSGGASVGYPQAITTNPVADEIYVADYYNNMARKFVASTGSYVGWVGGINTQPTGGVAGCSTASVGTITPGWCIGGASSTYPTSGGAMNMASGIALDHVHDKLYVHTIHGTINRYVASTGAYEAYTGVVETTPTGGVAGCTSIIGYDTTPGWCTGGDQGYGDSTIGSTSGWGTLAIDTVNFKLFTSDSDNLRVQKYDGTTGKYEAYLGSEIKRPSRWLAEKTAADGAVTPGDFYRGHMAIDRVNGYIYHSSVNAIHRYKIDTGEYGGWMGSVRIPPTGGAAGCTSLTYGGTTSGWCLGGDALFNSTTANGFYRAQDLVFVPSHNRLYLTDQYRIVRVNPVTGVVDGWMGVVDVTPTGGDSGCTTTAPGNYTPGWCTGGLARFVLQESSFTGASGLGIDPSANVFYVFDQFYRIKKFNLTTGAYLGWAGFVGATAPTGGDAGCTSTTNTSTPGWCIGGSIISTMGIADTLNLTYMRFDPVTKYFYVTSQYYPLILKFSANGTYVGWIGKIGTSPTGGAAGCAGAAVGTITPGWCKGGASATGTANGAFSAIQALDIDPYNDWLYVVDSNNDRIDRFKASTGTSHSWYGTVLTSPTDGDTGCKNLGIGKITPGWCKGGSSTGSNLIGGFMSAMGLALDPLRQFLIIFDSSNSRFMRLSQP